MTHKPLVVTDHLRSGPLFPELEGMPDIEEGDTVRLTDTGIEFKVLRILDNGNAVLEPTEGEGPNP